MDDTNEKIANALAAVEEAESRAGKDDIEVSYKLDELAAALKADGRHLEAANTSARAKTIRSARFATESSQQEEKFGSTTALDQRPSATAWLKKLHRMALIASLVVFVIAAIFPTKTQAAHITRDLIGSSSIATFLQLLLFPIKSIPRIMKFTIILIASGSIWMLFG